MTPPNVKPAPDRQDRCGEAPGSGSVDKQPSCPSFDTSSRHEESIDPLVLAARGPEKSVWVDLLGPNREQLEEVRQTLGFSPEVVTHCLLPAHTPKVISIDSTLFLVTFLGARAPQGLFTLRALKICAAPGFVLTVRGRASTTRGLRQRRLPNLPNANNGRTGHLLRLILEGTVESYKTISADLREHLPRETRRESGQWQRERIWHQQMRRKGEQFDRFLHQQRTFLQEVARAGKTLLDPDERTRLQWLAERVGVLARRVEEIIQTPQEGKSLMEQELTVILTKAEKQTALIGKRCAFVHFTKVDLSDAVFREADLEGTRFTRGDLRGADFRRAKLLGAIFSFCDLHEADFTDANLEGANFRTSFGLSPAMLGYIRSHGGLV